MLIFNKLWNESRVLTATCVLMLAAFVFSAAGIYWDARLVTGAPAWLKPAKFALSTSIFAGTMAWLFQYITVSRRLKRGLAWIFSLILVLEVGIIDAQAARGVSSHFNASTPLDIALFALMGVSIGLLWLAMIGVAVLLFRQRFSDVTWGWALRLGMTISVIGAAAAGMMLGPTHEQTVQLRMHEKPAAIGGHTVGAPDGGPGLPGTDWSREHGDLRIPHFFGLHAIQIVPLLTWIYGRRGRVVFAIAGSYLGFLAILTWQALRGQSIIEPDTATLMAFGVWLGGTILALFWSKRGEANRARLESVAL